MNTIARNQINFGVSLDGLNNKVVAPDFGQKTMEALSYEYSNNTNNNNNNNNDNDMKKIVISTNDMKLSKPEPPLFIKATSSGGSPTAHRKRSKPRRQSGLQTANITEDTFRQSRPSLPRDDSVLLLKQETTNAIPMIVPLVPDTTNTGAGSAGSAGPLSRIQRCRRRKPRRLSGDAVEHETRPVLVRDDSLLLTKKKLAGLFPMTYEKDDQDEKEVEEDGIATTPQQQRQQGYVRQISSSGAARSA